MKNSHQIKTGGDPRTLPEYASLRDELAKLNHPARPDVNWTLAEQLSLSLFRQNGVELQTLCWYTLARTRLAGMAGLNEGLAIMEVLLSRQWGIMWPQPVHARMEIMAGFSHRLQSTLRTLTLNYADLPLVYQAEEHLNALRDVLQRLELKNASQVGELCTFMHNAAIRLENMDAGTGSGAAVVVPLSAPILENQIPSGSEPLIYVAREDPAAPGVVNFAPKPSSAPLWRSFAAGMLVMLAVGSAGFWGWQNIYPQPTSPLPVTASEAALVELGRLPPLLLQDYGYELAGRGKPEQIEDLKAQWARYLTGSALPPEQLSGWHQGMAGLSDLTRRLNALDERKGKYLTGSELKSMVFTITQHFSRSTPLEERLYSLSQSPTGTPLPDAQLTQTDMQIRQLLNRYALIKQQVEKR